MRLTKFMAKLMATSALLSISTISCSGSGPEAPGSDIALPSLPEAAPPVLPVFRWSITYQTQCDSRMPEECLGAFGFTVSDDGTFQVGPSTDGETYRGSIEAREAELLKPLLSAAWIKRHEALNETRGEPNCRESLRVTWEDKTSFRCQDTSELIGSLKQLAEKYHPERFPNPCIYAANDFEEVEDPVKHCRTSSDCAYLDENFLPLPEEYWGEVMVDDCSYVRPLVTANTFEAVAQQLKLLMSKEIAEKICGKDKKRKGCTERKVMDFRNSAPVCDHGVCVMPRK